jgi:hypothetical protein
MNSYEVIIFNPKIEYTTADILGAYYNNSWGMLSYYQIIACSIANILPNSTLKMVYTGYQDEYIRDDGKLYLTKSDNYGVDLIQYFDTSICVRNIKTNKYFYIDFQDGPIYCINIAKNDDCIGVFAPQHKHLYDYANYNMEIFKHSHKFHPLTFFPTSVEYSENNELREIIYKIRTSNKLIPKMFFSGQLYSENTNMMYYSPYTDSYHRTRETAEILVDKYKDWVYLRSGKDFRNTPYVDYLKEVAKYSVPLAFPGHPWSHREPELWSFGIPTLSNTYTCTMMYPLLPNVHYIDAGTTGKDVRDRELDPERAADLIFNKFKKVYLNVKYLNFLTNSLIKRYETFSSPLKIGSYIINYIKDMGIKF